MNDKHFQQFQANEANLQSLQCQIMLMEARMKLKYDEYTSLSATLAAKSQELTQAETALANLRASQKNNDNMMAQMQSMSNHYHQNVFMQLSMHQQQIQKQEQEQRDAIIRTHENDLTQWIAKYENDPKVKQLRSAEHHLVQEKEKLVELERSLDTVRINNRRNDDEFYSMENRFIIDMAHIAVEVRDKDVEINQLYQMCNKNKIEQESVLVKMREREEYADQLVIQLKESESNLFFQLLEDEDTIEENENVNQENENTNQMNKNPSPQKSDLSRKSSFPSAEKIIEREYISSRDVELNKSKSPEPLSGASPNIPQAEWHSRGDESELNQNIEDDDGPSTEQQLERGLSSLSISFTSSQKRVHFEQPVEQEPNPSNETGCDSISPQLPPSSFSNFSAIFPSSSNLTNIGDNHNNDYENELNLSNIDDDSLTDLFKNSKDRNRSIADFNPSPAKRPKMYDDHGDGASASLTRMNTADEFNFDDTVGVQMSGGFRFDDVDADGAEDDGGFDFGDPSDSSDRDMGNIF